MPTLISELAALCAAVPGHEVQLQAADMLVTVSLAHGRRQTVKVSSHRHGPVTTLHLQSRSAPVTRPDVVRDALKRNAEATRAGFALDVTADPPALDVVAGLVADPARLPLQDFVDALHEVALLADHVERRLTPGDQF